MPDVEPSALNIELDPDLFMRKMLRELTGLLQDVVGIDEAEGYINSVGSAVGAWIEQKYRDEMGDIDLEPEAIAGIFVDLKRRIGGEFYVISVDEDKIVVGNHRCPFGSMAHRRDGLCMMTSNVFGRIAADHVGYARVDLEETIARGSNECRIVVYLSPNENASPDARDYYRIDRIKAVKEMV